MKSFIAKFDNFRLSHKLPVIIILSALITGCIVGFVSYKNAYDEIHREAEVKLSSLLSAKKHEFERYLRSIESDLNFNSKNPFVHQAQRAFKKSWDELGDKNINQTEYLQKWYIDDNPNPTGSKEVLDYAQDGSEYSKNHRIYHDWLRTFLRDRGYYDIFLFDTQGNLVYTVFKELDYATNVNNGKWANTDLGNAFREAIKSADGTQAFFDFKPYAPSNDAPASFMSTPLTDSNGKNFGTLVYQMPIDAINEIMKVSDGLGQTGEISLIGADFLMRNDSRLSKESTILKRKVETQAVKDALAGKKGTSEEKNYNGNDVLAAYEPFEFKGAKYALVATIDSDEVFAPLVQMRNSILVQVLIVIGIIAGIGLLIARHIAGRIAALADSVQSIAKGDNTEIPSINNDDEIGNI
ncbi:cache domain-containing protein, partial [Rickettsiales bacterium]|nr:cache domain-containing protein [Rickettsiales bacterium]